MHRKTFEIIAKWVAMQTDVKVELNAPVPCPMADPKSKIIRIPDISSQNALAGLSDIMHEAGHIKYSAVIPEEFMLRGGHDKEILNVMEDIRVDREVLGLLPNIRSFYEESWRSDMRPKSDKATKEFKALVNGIANATEFGNYCYRDKETMEFESKIAQRGNLANGLYNGANAIHWGDWQKLEKAIKEIKDLLELKDQKQPKPPPGGSGKGNGSGKGKGKIQEECSGTQQKEDGQQEEQGQGSGDKESSPIQGVSGFLHTGKRWGTGTLEGASAEQFGAAFLEQLTIDRLKEMLNTTEIEIIDNGRQLNSENLISYFTGDVEELFKEEEEVKKKKSKVMFLMDCSGSMASQLYDGTQAYRTLAKAVKAVTHILDEIIESEGIDVSYCVRFFDHRYLKPADEKNWEKEFVPMGGTSFWEGFKGAMDEMCADQTIDGKRIIITMTDGETESSDIDNANKLIVAHAADIRIVFIGVGMDPGCKMAREMVGDHIIISEDQTSEILLDALSTAL